MFFVCARIVNNPQENAAENFGDRSASGRPKGATHPAGADAPARERNGAIARSGAAHDGKRKQRGGRLA
jgi:hypothetical protein